MEKKAAEFVLLFVVVGIYCIGMTFFDFNSSEKAVIYSFIAASTTGIFLTIVTIKTNSFSYKVQGLKPFKRILFYFLFSLLLSFISFFIYSSTISGVYTKYFGSSFEAVTKVSDKSDFYEKRGCNTRIYTEYSENKICVSKEFYNSVAIGDEIKVQGMKSDFGFYISSFSN